MKPSRNPSSVINSFDTAPPAVSNQPNLDDWEKLTEKSRRKPLSPSSSMRQ